MNALASKLAGRYFYYFAWLYGNKGVIIGRSLADHLGKDFIPPAFSKVILAAVGASER